MSKSAKIIASLLGIILVLMIIVIVKNPKILYMADVEKNLRDSLSLLQTHVEQSESRQSIIQTKYDSLLNIDQEIIYRNHDKIKFVFTDATPNQLDSIIRANWYPRHY